MEHKAFPVEVKMTADGSGTLSGYASTFSNFDSVGERVVKGAFAASLPEFLSSGFIAVGHDWASLPVATPTEAYEDEHGLFVAGAFHSTTAAQDARTVVKERIERGKSVKLSIGYEVMADEYVEEGRLLKQVKLYEWSLVQVPANPQASLTNAKRLLPEGAPLHLYADQAEALLSQLVTEARALEGRRAKEGRVLSDANRKRITSLQAALTAVLADLDDLLTATAPKDAGKVQELYLEFQKIEAQLRGDLPWAS